MDSLEKLRELLAAKKDSGYADALKALVQSKTPRTPQTDKEYFEQISKEEPLLAAIAMTESSGGTNYKHDFDHKSNTQAGGMFGMMPRTAMDIIKRNDQLKAKYPELEQAAKENNPQIFTTFFNEFPEIAMDFAKDHFNHNKARTKNDKELAYSWYNGLTGALKARQRKGALDNSPYVQTVMGYYKKPTAQQDQPMLDLEQKPATELAGIDALKRLLGHE